MHKLKCDFPNDPNYPFNYCPSFPAAVTFSVFFFVLTCAHFLQSIVHRKRFLWVIVMAGIWETLSFSTRVVALYDINPVAFQSPSQILVLLAPLWINAGVYMMFGRSVHFFMPERKIGWVSGRRMGMCFVLLDITAFIMQAAGGILASQQPDGSANTSHLIDLGLKIYQGGIGLQELFIILFLGLVIKFEVSVRNMEREGVELRARGWRRIIYPIYGALLLITIRVIYRLVEFSQGFESGLVKHEAYFYVLEATPMVLVLLTFIIWHPGCVLVGPDSEFPKKEKKKKEKKSKKGNEVKEMGFGYLGSSTSSVV